MKVIIVLETKQNEKAIFSHFFLRYKTERNQIIYGDVPRSEENLLGSQFGFFEMYQEITVFFDGKLITKYEIGDLLYRLNDNKRFKLVTINDNIIGGVLTSVDTRARYLLNNVDMVLTTFLV
jgi:hypothetical protein